MTQPSGSRTRRALATGVMTLLAVVVPGATGPSSAGGAQGPPGGAGSRRLAIPYLANATSPADLDFTAAECDLDPDGERMACRFRQVFLTTSPLDATSCVITTNGYEQDFRRDAPARWVHVGDAAGACGIVETTTLEDGGGTHWTMTIRKAATLNADQPACRAASEDGVTYDWRSVKRALPCRSIQPGAIER